MLRAFRYIGFVEGITTLVLFGIAMPLKYWAGNPALVPPSGWIHGVSFLVYIVTLTPALWGRGFTFFQWLRTFIAAFFSLRNVPQRSDAKKTSARTGCECGHLGLARAPSLLLR